MRLYNIYYLCKNSIKPIAELTGKQNHSNTAYTLNGWCEARDCLTTVSAISFLTDYVNEIFEIFPAYQFKKEGPELSNSDYRLFISKKELLVARLDAIVKLYQSMDAGESKEGVDIKIPACGTLDEYIGYMKDINFILNQCPLISNCDEQVVFNTVDVGSMWLSLLIKGAVGTHVILNTLAKLSEIAIKFSSNYKVMKMQDEYLASMKQKNEIGQDVIDTFNQIKNKMLDDDVSELEKECGVEITNPEERDKTAKTIEKLSTLIDKGVEIYSAIETPQEIKVMFPFAENSPLLPDGLQRLIEEKKENILE